MSLENVMHFVVRIVTDEFAYPALLSILAVLARVAARIDHVRSRRASDGMITRGERSLATLYAVYGASAAVLVGLALTVEIAADHRVIATLYSVGISLYLCLLNRWSRNKLIVATFLLSKREHPADQ